MKKALAVLFICLLLLSGAWGCKKRQESGNLVIRMETDSKIFMVKVTSEAFSDAFIRDDGQDLEKGKRIYFTLPEGTYRYTVTLYGKDELAVKREAFAGEFSSDKEQTVYVIVTGGSEEDLAIKMAR